MGMVKPSGTAFLATTSTRKKVASSKKEAKKAAKRRKQQLKDEYEREELSKEFEGSSECQIDKGESQINNRGEASPTFAESIWKKPRIDDDWPIEDQKEMIAADGKGQGELNEKIERQFSSNRNKLPWTLRGRSR